MFANDRLVILGAPPSEIVVSDRRENLKHLRENDGVEGLVGVADVLANIVGIGAAHERRRDGGFRDGELAREFDDVDAAALAMADGLTRAGEHGGCGGMPGWNA